MASTASVTLRKGGNGFQVFGLVSACLLSFCFASACQTSCGTGNQTPITYADGIKVDADTYESTALDGEWLHYPSQRRFVFPHHLDATIYDIKAYVAFSAHPVPSDDLGSSDIAFASGDILVIEKQTADELGVRNDTCSEEYLYVRVTAHRTVTDGGL
jgi:hypothetical protein